MLGRSGQCIYTILKRYDEEGRTQPAKLPGRPGKLSDRNARQLALAVMRNRAITCQELVKLLPVKVHAQTVTRYLKKEGFVHANPVKKPPAISRKQAARRVEFADRHLNWTLEDWKGCIFSGESSVSNIGLPHYGEFVFKGTAESGGDHHSSHPPKANLGEVVVLVWGAISYNARSELVCFIEGKVNGERYKTEVLEPAVRPLCEHLKKSEKTCKRIVFQQYSTATHTTNANLEYLSGLPLELMDWPASSPDLNPLEPVWVHLRRELAKQHPELARATGTPAAIKKRLAEVLTALWNDIPQAYLQRLIRSMPGKMAEVKQVRGRLTKSWPVSRL